MSKQSPVFRVAYVGVISSILLIVQVALAALPNIELVSFLILMYTLFDARLTKYAIAVFVLLEGVIYGFHLWWVTYCYVWYILYLLTWLTRKWASPVFCALLCGTFGLLFGTLSSLPYFFTTGPMGGVAYILSGIPFDIVHCMGNAVLTLLLFKPVQQLYKRIL